MQLYRVQSMADFAAVASGNPASAQEQRLVSAPLQMASSENTEHWSQNTEHSENTILQLDFQYMLQPHSFVALW